MTPEITFYAFKIHLELATALHVHVAQLSSELNNITYVSGLSPC